MTAQHKIAEIHAEVPEQRALTVANGETPLTGLMQLAIERMSGENGTALVETLERLVGLHERVEAKKAVDAFNVAMATFQEQCPSIKKTSKASINSNSGSKFGYTYAELDQIASVVNPILGRNGLSYSWDSGIENGQIKCTCHVRHIQGHVVSATFQCPVESKAGMSEQQKYGAALTYARRQALVQVLGLTTTDQDNDGGATQTNHDKINSSQAAQLSAMIDDTATDMEQWLKYYDVERVGDLPVSKFQAALNQLNKKKEKAAHANS